MSDVLAKIIEDLVKGAEATEGFVRGSKMKVEIGQDHGREEKLASLNAVKSAGFMSNMAVRTAPLAGTVANAVKAFPRASLALAGTGLGALGGAVGAEKGHRGEGALHGGLAGGGLSLATMGAIRGMENAYPSYHYETPPAFGARGYAGRPQPWDPSETWARPEWAHGKSAGVMPAAAGLLSKGLGLAAKNPGAAMGLAGAGVGALSGAAGAESGHRMEGAMKGGLVGGGLGLAAPAGLRALGKNNPSGAPAMLGSGAPKVAAYYAQGHAAAVHAFDIKTAFLGAVLPLAGQLLGGTAMRAGAGALARGAGGKALGNIAGKALPRMGSGIGGMATDMIGGSLGGAVAQKMTSQPPPPQGV